MAKKKFSFCASPKFEVKYIPIQIQFKKNNK